MRKLQVLPSAEVISALPEALRHIKPQWMTVAVLLESTAELPDLSDTYPASKFESRVVAIGEPEPVPEVLPNGEATVTEDAPVIVPD